MQLAHQDFALDLQPDGEEEDSHEGVVDKSHQRHGVAVVAEEVERAYLEGYLVRPQGVVEAVEAGYVDKQQRQDGGKY